MRPLALALTLTGCELALGSPFDVTDERGAGGASSASASASGGSSTTTSTGSGPCDGCALGCEATYTVALDSAGRDDPTAVAMLPCGASAVAGARGGQAAVRRLDAEGAVAQAFDVVAIDGKSPGRSAALALELRADRSMVVGGAWTGTVKIPPAPEDLTASGNDGFLALVHDPAAQTVPDWALRVGGSGAQTVNGVAATGAKIYAFGEMNGATSVAGLPPIASTEGDPRDVFVIEFDASVGVATGKAWLPGAGTDARHQRADAIAARGSLVAISGLYTGSRKFVDDVSPGSTGGPSFNSGPNVVRQFGYVAALDFSKDQVVTKWFRGFGSNTDTDDPSLAASGALDVAIDAGNNVYVGGFFRESFTLVDSETTVTAKGNSDAIVIKYSPTGGALWAATWGSAAGVDNVRGLAVSDDGRVFVAGYHTGAVDLGGGFSLPAPAGGAQHYFLVELAADTGRIVAAKGHAMAVPAWGVVKGATGSPALLDGFPKLPLAFANDRLLGANSGVTGSPPPFGASAPSGESAAYVFKLDANTLAP